MRFLDWILMPFLKFCIWKFTVAKPFGIPLNITGAFLLFLAMFFFLPFLSQPPSEAYQYGRIIIAVLLVCYLCVIPHEYGHALVARKLGYEVKDISLWAGLPSIDGDWYQRPAHEFIIGIAGPLVNAVLIILLLPIMLLNLYGEPPMISYVASLFFMVNFIIMCFNLLPVYPMDGGRTCPCYCDVFHKRHYQSE